MSTRVGSRRSRRPDVFRPRSRCEWRAIRGNVMVVVSLLGTVAILDFCLVVWLLPPG